jgi:hypothetical protein
MRFLLYNGFNALSVVCAAIFFRSLKKYSIQVIFPIVIINFLIEIFATNYRWFNLNNNVVIYNTSYLFLAPFYYALYFYMLGLKPKANVIYFTTVIISFIIYVIDYLHKYGKIELVYISEVIFSIQQIILSLIIIGRLTLDQRYKIPLSKEPYFWICASRILFSLVIIVWDGMYEFLFGKYPEAYNSEVFHYFPLLTSMAVDIFLCYSLYLCWKNLRREPLQLSAN